MGIFALSGQAMTTQWFFKKIFQMQGWRVQSKALQGVKQSITIAAPHTSNLDFPLSMAAFDSMGLQVKFTIKKEWVRFPFKTIMSNLGAIAIDRSPRRQEYPRQSMVDVMANLFNDNPELHILVTPEGSRSLRTEWKTGFWYAAKKANVPILLGFLDYKEKIAGVAKVIYPSDFESDMREIMQFYSNVTPRHPEQFSVDIRYIDHA